MLLPTLAVAYAFMIAGIFLATGYSKWRSENRSFYQQTIEAYDITPAHWAGPLVRLIAAIEIGVALLILVPVTQKIGLICAAILLSIYGYSFVKQLKEGKERMSCGCAGPSSELTISTALVFRNAILITLCLLAGFTDTPALNTTWFIILPTVIVMGLFYLCVEQLMSNQQKVQALT